MPFICVVFQQNIVYRDIIIGGGKQLQLGPGVHGGFGPLSHKRPMLQKANCRWGALLQILHWGPEASCYTSDRTSFSQKSRVSYETSNTLWFYAGNKLCNGGL